MYRSQLYCKHCIPYCYCKLKKKEVKQKKQKNKKQKQKQNKTKKTNGFGVIYINFSVHKDGQRHALDSKITLLLENAY